MFTNGTAAMRVPRGMLVVDPNRILVTRGIRRQFQSLVGQIRQRIDTGQSIQEPFERYCAITAEFFISYGIDLAQRFELPAFEFVAWTLYMEFQEPPSSNQDAPT